MTSHLINVAGLIGLLLGLLYLMQPSMAFQPSARLEGTPGDWDLAYETVWIETEDGVRLHGWLIPAEGSDRVLLFFHGNAGNISHRRESIEDFHALGITVLIIDYRGYGGSSGRPSEDGLYRDASAAWRYLVDERGIPPDRIIVFGRSLGGVVAARLASRVRPAGLILESTFSSARAFIRAHYGLLGWLIPSRFAFDTAEYVSRVACPVLVLHSPDDEIVPFRLGRAVFDAAPQPKAFHRLRGRHNSGFIESQPGYSEALERFIRGL